MHQCIFFYSARITAEFLEQKNIRQNIYFILLIVPCVTFGYFCNLNKEKKNTWASFLFRRGEWWGKKAYLWSIPRPEGGGGTSMLLLSIPLKQALKYIPRNGWLEAFNVWKFCLQKCFDLGGNYFKHSKEFVTLTCTIQPYLKAFSVTLAYK